MHVQVAGATRVWNLAAVGSQIWHVPEAAFGTIKVRRFRDWLVGCG